MWLVHVETRMRTFKHTCSLTGSCSSFSMYKSLENSANPALHKVCCAIFENHIAYCSVCNEYSVAKFVCRNNVEHSFT